MNINPDDTPEVPHELVALLGLLTGLTKKPKQLALDDAGGVLVSTVVTHDAGPETAVCVEQNAHPVERYATEEEALQGHARWLARMRDEKPSTIQQLGYGWVLGEEQITLTYDTEWSAEVMALNRERES